MRPNDCRKQVRGLGQEGVMHRPAAACVRACRIPQHVAQLFLFLMLCFIAPMTWCGGIGAYAASSRSPTQSQSSDETLTMTMSPSPLPGSTSVSTTPSPDASTTIGSLSRSPSPTSDTSRSPSPSNVNTVTPNSPTRSSSPEPSGTITISADESGYSYTTNLTASRTITLTSQISASKSHSFSGDVTRSGAAGGAMTLTLTQTVTMTMSVTTTTTVSLSPSAYTPSLTKDVTPSSTATPTVTLALTDEASWSTSQTSSRSPTPDSSVSSSVSVSVSEIISATETGTATLRKTTSLTPRQTPTNTWSETEVETRTLASLTGSRSEETFTGDLTQSERTVSASVSATIPPWKKKKLNNNSDITITSTISVTLSFFEKRSVSPTEKSSRTETFSEYLSPTSSATFTALSASDEVTKTMTLFDSITTTGTLSVSSTTSRSEATVSEWRTKSVTKSATIGSWQQSMSTTDTLTFSKELTPSPATSTLTLTYSPKQESNTRRRSRSMSVSSTQGTVTMMESSTYTVSNSVSTSDRTQTLSKRTEEHTATVTPSAESSGASRTHSPSQEGKSRSTSASSSPSAARTRFSFSSSLSTSLQTATGRMTITRERRGGGGGGDSSRTATPSPETTVTITDSATIASNTHSFPYFVSLDNSLAASIGAVLFPSLDRSTAPCMSLALYIEVPLVIIFVFQGLLYLISKSLGWNVNCDTHRHVPMWRSLLISTSYAGFFAPCHLRCAYAHTLRLMVQLLVLLLMLECLVYQLDPQAGNMATFCVALALVVSQIVKPITHAAYSTFRFPKDEELSAQMHLTQMKRIVRLRQKEKLAAKRAERIRRREEGLDDVSTTTDEEPEFAYDTEKVVTFDYLDNRGGMTPFSNPSLNELQFGRDVDLTFPDEQDVFGGQDYKLPPALADDLDMRPLQSHHQETGPGYVDVSFPGEEGVKIVDFYGDRRLSTGDSRGSFVKDVPRLDGSPRQRGGGTGASSPPLRKKQSWVDPDRISIDMMSLGTLASFSSPTRAALAVADGKVASSSEKKRKPKKKRIGPGRDGVVVIPDFDDDFGVKHVPDSDEEDAEQQSTGERRSAAGRAGKPLTSERQPTTVSLFSDLDPEDLLEDDSDDLNLMNGGSGGKHHHSNDDDEEDKASSVGSSVRYRTEVHPIVTTHLRSTALLVVVLGVLLFAVDRFRHLCATAYHGSFSGLWGLSILLDATIGDGLVAAIVYVYRRLTASGEEGTYVQSFLHPFDGELRARMYEHLSDRFNARQYLSSRQSIES